MKHWQLNINSIDGKRILIVHTDINPKVTHWQMKQLILRTNAPMILTHGTEQKIVGIEFFNGMTQAVKLASLKAANYD